MDALLAYSDSSDDEREQSDEDRRGGGGGGGGSGGGSGGGGGAGAGKGDVHHNKKRASSGPRLPSAAEAFAAVGVKVGGTGKRRRKAGDDHDGMWPALVYIDVSACDGVELAAKAFARTLNAPPSTPASPSREPATGAGVESTRDVPPSPSPSTTAFVWEPTVTPTSKTSIGPHVSLSRTVLLVQHEIDMFIEALRVALVSRARNGPLAVLLDHPYVFINKDASRTFVGQAVGAGRDEVVELIHEVDAVVARFRGEPFYADPVPHVSMCVCDGDARAAVKALRTGSPSGSDKTHSKGLAFPAPWLDSDRILPVSAIVSGVHVRVGNRFFSLPWRLPTPTTHQM